MSVAPRNLNPSRTSLKRSWKMLLIGLIILIIVVAGSGLGSFYLLSRKTTAPATVSQIAGYAVFVSSGQVSENSNQGINDEMQIDLQHVSLPGPGKNYYAWLLGDSHESKIITTSLGVLTVKAGVAHLFYPGDQLHTNLLAISSSLLVTEEDTSPHPLVPSLDPATWRYHAMFPQTPSPMDSNHFSLLDHLRHLLAAEPTLDRLGLPGGLDIWSVRNTEKVMEWAASARDYWQTKRSDLMRSQLIRILEYLDGENAVQQDLPPGASRHADRKMAQVGLLTLNSSAQASGDISLGYLSETQKQLQSLLTDPGSTPVQRKLALASNRALNNVVQWFEQVHQDARNLLLLPDKQLLTQQSLSILDDIATIALYAYVGQLDPSTNAVEDGIIQIHYNIEHLADFNITKYTGQ